MTGRGSQTFSDAKREEMRDLAEYLERYRLSDPHIGPDDCDLIVAALQLASCAVSSNQSNTGDSS